jgi:hypothetical protein
MTEKLIVEGETLTSSAIIDRIEMVGFSATEIIDFDVNDGKVTFLLDTTDHKEEINTEFKLLEGVLAFDISDEKIDVEFIPEEISAKQIWLQLEKITGSLPELQIGSNDESKNGVDNGKKTVNFFLRQFLLS